jgi:hypothetical protein
MTAGCSAQNEPRRHCFPSGSGSEISARRLLNVDGMAADCRCRLRGCQTARNRLGHPAPWRLLPKDENIEAFHG